MKVYAHRGYSGKYPENTMMAFKKAVEAGCDGIELDVQLTKDGKVVIIHDERIDRTTDGSGLVKDYTFEELCKFNASIIRPGCEFQHIPSFEEYCEWARDYDLITNIELKTGCYYYEGLEARTIDLIHKYGLDQKVMFSSFNHVSLIKTLELAPEIPCGALVEGSGVGNAGHYCSQYGFACYHPGYKGLTEELVKNCRDHGVQLNVWTVNDMGALETLYEWGCEGVITNYPGVCYGWLKGKIS